MTEHRRRVHVVVLGKRRRVGCDHRHPGLRAERFAQQRNRQIDQQPVAGIAAAICVQQHDLFDRPHRTASSITS
jgi:hypothetical protein